MGSTAGLAPAFKKQVDGLLAASHGAVTVTSGFRTYSQQLALRKTNGCPDVLKSPARDCRVPTAIPGSSMHEKGLAVDLGGDHALAAQLAPQFGLRRTVADEPWHYESTNATIPGVPQQGGGPTGGVVDAVAGAGGDLADSIVGPVIEGLKKILVTGAFLFGGLALVAAGAYRSSTGRSLTGDLAKKGAGVAKDAAVAAALA